jgi:transposase
LTGGCHSEPGGRPRRDDTAPGEDLSLQQRPILIQSGVMTAPDPLPADLTEAHAMILAERAARLTAEAEAATAKETKRLLDLEIERLKLEIARLRRQRFGTSSERSARLEQLELALTELQESVAEADAAGELQAAEQSPTAARSTTTPRKPARRPLPKHLPRTRVVYPAPVACPCCGGAVRKLGEEVTESLERLPARWFVVQHVREKAAARRSAKHRRRSIRLPAAVPGRTCWPRWCSASTGCTCR